MIQRWFRRYIIVESAIDHWKALPDVPYEPHVAKYEDGGFITYFVNDERCWAVQIDSKLTVFKDAKGKIVGVKLCVVK